jgi:uncharacterized protein with HEPN domain
MAAAGNIYRHEYEDVAAREVWDTLTRHFPPLRTIVDIELAAFFWKKEPKDFYT